MHLLRNGGGGGFVSARDRAWRRDGGLRGAGADRVHGRGGPLPGPGRAGRPSAPPPLVPLALLDDPGTGGRLAAALAERAARTDPRTVNRELSALRSAVDWWRH